MKKIFEQELKNAVQKSHSLADVCRELNLSKGGDLYTHLRKKIVEYKIDTSHFYSSQEIYSRVGKSERTFENVFCINSTCSGSTLRKWTKRYIKYICEECNNLGYYNNKPLTLQLDHINGNNTDNRVENLRYLCPNCHAQTDTYCGKGTREKEKLYKSVSEWRHAPKYYCRKVKNRPSKEELEILITKYNNWTYIGKMFGVNGNSVKKWAKLYGILDCKKRYNWSLVEPRKLKI